MSTLQVNLDKISSVYNEALPNFNKEEQHISVQIYQLLAKGEPVSHARVASTLNYPLEKVDEIIDGWIGIYHDNDNNIIGYWGISVQEQPHLFEVNGKTLYTWCAWDSLFIPEIIKKIARVESLDPISKERIRFTVSSEGIKDLNPVGAVMSYVKPENTRIDENVIQGFCHYIFFFTSEKTGTEWVSRHDNAGLMSLDDAFQLAKRKNEHQYPDVLYPATNQEG